MITGLLDIVLQEGADVLLGAQQSRARMREADQGHQHALDQLAARVVADERAADREFSRSLLAGELAAGWRVWEQVSVDTEKARREASPFRLPDGDVRAIAAMATDDGRLPALIIAPFLSQAPIPDRPDAGRQIWWRVQQRAGWTASLASLTGHLRPVEHLDTDLSLIRSALGSVPFVLVHGDAEADQVAIRVVGSGLLDDDAGAGGRATAVSFCGVLPLSPEGRLAGDALDSVVACAGALGEVSRLVRRGDQPRLHALVPEALRPGVTAIIVGGYGIVAESLASASWERNSRVVRGLQDLVAALPAGDGVRDRVQELLSEVMDRVAARNLRAG